MEEALPAQELDGIPTVATILPPVKKADQVTNFPIFYVPKFHGPQTRIL